MPAAYSWYGEIAGEYTVRVKMAPASAQSDAPLRTEDLVELQGSPLKIKLTAGMLAIPLCVIERAQKGICAGQTNELTIKCTDRFGNSPFNERGIFFELELQAAQGRDNGSIKSKQSKGKDGSDSPIAARRGESPGGKERGRRRSQISVKDIAGINEIPILSLCAGEWLEQNSLYKIAYAASTTGEADVHVRPSSQPRLPPLPPAPPHAKGHVAGCQSPLPSLTPAATLLNRSTATRAASATQ